MSLDASIADSWNWIEPSNWATHHLPAFERYHVYPAFDCQEQTLSISYSAILRPCWLVTS